MRPPPSLRLFANYPVTGGFALLALAVTLPKFAGIDVGRLYMDGHAMHGEPWRLATSALPHGSAMHLLFNLYWLWVFGTLVESALGHLRAAVLMITFAVVSQAAEFAFLEGGIGLSGVGYGLFGFLWVLSTRDPRFLGAVDRSTVQTFVVWFFVCIALTMASIMPVANIAHGIGAVTGMLAGLAMSPQAKERFLGTIGVPVLALAALVGAGPARPRINFSSRGYSAPFQMGYEALGEKRNDDAVLWLEEASRMGPNEPVCWYDLGIAYLRSGHPAEAAVAFDKAHALAPDDPNFR